MVESNYKWPYLLTTENDRATKIMGFLSPYIQDCKSILDFNCGYAPLYNSLPEMKFYGFDISKECIDHLKENKSNGHWTLCDDQNYNEDVIIDFFCFLGVSSGNRAHESQTEINSAVRLINKYNPKVILLETSTAVSVERFNKIMSQVPKYKEVLKGTYKIETEKNNERMFIICS